MFLDNFTLKDAQLLLSSQQILNSKLHNPDYKEPTQEVISYLADRVLELFQNDPEFKLYFDQPPFLGPCGCIGAQEGCMFCSCEEINLIYNYRFDILFYLKNK